jgi:glycerol-3-phosphate acyltransferase PlsY
MDIVLAILIGYVLGSIPCGLVFVKAVCGIDIRDYGSHNIGTTNVFRTVGARMASFVLLGDIGKGMIALYLTDHFISQDVRVQLFCAAAAILGHSYSLFLHFKGGRGVATGLGVLLYFMPDVSIFCLTVWMATVFVTRYVSLSSVIAAFLAPIAAWYRDYDSWLVGFTAIMAAIVILRHYDNMVRLKNGTENKIKEGHLSFKKKK